MAQVMLVVLGLTLGLFLLIAWGSIGLLDAVLPKEQERRIEIGIGAVSCVLVFGIVYDLLLGVVRYPVYSGTYGTMEYESVTYAGSRMAYLPVLAWGVSIPWLLDKAVYHLSVFCGCSKRVIVALWCGLTGVLIFPAVAVTNLEGVFIIYSGGWLVIGPIALLALALIDPVKIQIRRREEAAHREAAAARREFISKLDQELKGE